MADRKQGNGTAGAAVELFGEEGAFERRLLASAMGLPRVCRVKKCLQRKRCFGLGITRLEEHVGLAGKRFPAAMAQVGWDNVEDEKADS